MEYLIGLGGIVVGLAIAGFFIARLRTRLALAENQRIQAEQNAERETQRGQQYVQELKQQHREQTDALQAQYQAQLEKAELQYREQTDALRVQHRSQLEKAEQQYRDALTLMHRQHEEQTAQQIQLIREQMNTASERILKERAEQLSTTNREQLATILTPLQTHIQQMREAVERSDREQTATMQRLDASIKTSFQLSREVGERADRLAQALTGENKTQGNFGELRLRQLLEDMGLEEGTQFELQETMKDKDGRTVYEEEAGHRMVPDAILHFPDKRDVIIDSKMSMTAFEDYYNAESEEAKQDALRRHLASMRAHVNELAKKNYSRYIKDDRGRLDFVLMYVFSESALQLALTNAPTLWKEAYDRGVVISGSQNLYMMLRVLEMTWRQVRQVENQQEIMKTADELVNRVQLFAERMDDVKRQLERTAEAFQKVEASTAEGGQSIITTARKLTKMGASENPKRRKSLTNAQPTNEEQPRAIE